MAAILTLLPLSQPQHSQDALFGHFGFCPLLVTLDNSWKMDFVKMAFFHSCQNQDLSRSHCLGEKDAVHGCYSQPLTVQPISPSFWLFLPPRTITEVLVYVNSSVFAFLGWSKSLRGRFRPSAICESIDSQESSSDQTTSGNL